MAHFLTILSFLVLAGVSHAASPAEIYWKSVLPNSPMPSAIRDLIDPGLLIDPGKVTAPSPKKDSVGSIFFLEKDLHPGSKMTLHFTRATAGASLLSRGTADASAAAAMKSTLAECQAPPLAGEAKLCATSLESMVEFATSHLGTRNVRAVSTSVSREATGRQAYTVTGVRRMPVSDMVACHGMGYPYGVFGCHTTQAAAYTVSLAGADGTTAKAVAACHVDAAPGVAEAYKKLGVAPGSVPVCHYLPQDDMLWVRN